MNFKVGDIVTFNGDKDFRTILKVLKINDDKIHFTAQVIEEMSDKSLILEHPEHFKKGKISNDWKIVFFEKVYNYNTPLYKLLKGLK